MGLLDHNDAIRNVHLAFAYFITPEGSNRQLNAYFPAFSIIINYLHNRMASSYQIEEARALELAEAVKQGKFPSIRAATRETPHLYDRVRRRVNGVQSGMERPGAGRLLSDTEEEGIIIWLKRLESIHLRASP